ncbi:MAG: hypothetical protein LBQ55_08600 [Treponema sp.]|jgi:hypothetical protein|nr:hypothetical protein [Treponema sp.]
MKDTLSLNDLFKQYACGNLEKRRFEELIFKSAAKDYHRYHFSNWDKEEYIDYLCWLYPRISHSIDNYHDTGASFDAYIGALIRWSVKEYRSREADHRITEYSAWTAHAAENPPRHATDDLWAHDAEPEYDVQAAAPLINVSNPRQILILLLKSYYFVSDDFIRRTAPIIGMEEAVIRAMLDRLRKQRAEREAAIQGLQERVHCQFFRCITFESRMHAVPADLVHHAKMKARLERARRRLASMKKRLAGMRLDATNRQIAELLGVSKGSVDSSLHALRLGWKRHQKKRKNQDRCIPRG